MLAAVGLGTQPLVILAKTLKGAGVSFLQDKEGWHGKPLSKEEAARAIAELQPTAKSGIGMPIPAPSQLPAPKNEAPASYPADHLQAGRHGRHARGLRQRAGCASARRTRASWPWTATPRTPPSRRSSPRSSRTGSPNASSPSSAWSASPSGFSTRGKVPFASTFACFLTRAYDQIRVAGISMANLKLVGSHVGVSIGEDGPSQMGLEDLAMMRAIVGSTVLYASDAVCAEKLVEQMAAHKGICFLRTSRPKTPVIYNNDEAVPDWRRQGAAPVRRGQGHGGGGRGDAATRR